MHHNELLFNNIWKEVSKNWYPILMFTYYTKKFKSWIQYFSPLVVIHWLNVTETLAEVFMKLSRRSGLTFYHSKYASCEA